VTQCHERKSGALFDRFAGEHRQRRGHFDADCLRGLQVERRLRGLRSRERRDPDAMPRVEPLLKNIVGCLCDRER
jgi:hypothetical protein